MKKLSVFMTLFLFCSVVWITAGAKSFRTLNTSYAPDESVGLITNVTADAETQLTSNCTWEVTDPNNDNYAFMTIGNYLAALIDGDSQTYWHSDPVSMDYTKTDEWIQVDLKRTNIDKFYFKLMRREDVYNGKERHGIMPQSFEIRATNTPTDENSWVKITTVTGIPAETESDDKFPYMSPLVNMGTAYRYVRFICRASNQPYWCFSEFQMYEAKEVSDPTALLQLLVDSINKLSRTYLVGTNPGYYPEAKVAAYTSALDAATTLLASSPTADASTAAAATLRAALADVDASAIKMHAGYFRFVSAYSAFETSQSLQKAMRVSPSESRVTWGDLDATDPYEIWKVTAASDTSWSIQNASGDFINTVPGDATVSTVYVPTSTTQITGQTFTDLGQGSAQFYIANVDNDKAYHCLGHGNGTGTNGYIVPASTGLNTPACWYLEEVDAATAEPLIAQAQAKANAERLAILVAQARTVRNLANDYQALITEANDEDDAHNQFSSNARWTYLDKASGGQGKYANLLDGSKDTYFHSNAAAPINAYHYLQVDLKRTDISSFTFKMLRRGDDNWHYSWNQLPIDIEIFATNDATALTDATPFDDTDSPWKRVTELNSGFPDANSHAYYTSPAVTMKQAYQYIRFVVKNTLNRGNDPSGMPYFNISEFQMYNTTPTATSEYFTVEGMGSACDALDAVITAAQAKIDNLTATADDTTALKNAMAAVKALYVDRTAIQNVVKDKLDEASTAYQTAFSYDELITEAPDDGSGQVTSSCLWTTPSADNGDVSYSSLIDNNLNTFYHSDPAWGPALNQSGAYLQFDLRRNDIQKFNFTMNGRVGSNHDTPNLIDVYATNDPSDEANWKIISSLSKGFPENISGAYYLSPDIDLGATYRYVRLYVLGTTSGHNYFNIAELHLYNAVANQAKSQYYYTAGVKEAADALKSLIDQVQAKIDANTLTNVEDTVALNKAIAALGALVYNPASFTYLVNDAQNYADNAEVGTDIAQFAQGDVDALKTAITTAKSSVSYDVVKRAEFEAAKASLETAVETFLSKVNTITPNKWYYIVNAADATTYPAISGKTLRISDTSTKTGLAYGNGFGVADNVTDVMYTNDPYSMWRFVPIEGTKFYALQNRGTAHFAGASVAGNSTIMTDNVPQPYQLYYLGKSTMAIHNADTLALTNYGFTADAGSIIEKPSTVTAISTPASWKFVPVETQEFDVNTTENYIRSACFPFTIPAGTFGTDGVNPTIKVYGVRKLTVDDAAITSTVELYEIKDAIPAGTPFLLEAGDHTTYDAANATATPFAFEPTADELVTTPLVSNGLVGTLDGITLKKAGLGYLNNNVLSITTSAAVALSGQRAYIDPSQVKELTDKETALTLTVNGKLTGVNAIEISKPETGKVNVYTIDGKLLKRNVKATDANKGLTKGLYIVGKKKVAVK
jgi:hypothetical protein